MKSRALFVSIGIWLCSSMLSAQTVESFSRSIDSLRVLKKYADALVKVNEATQLFAGNLNFVKYKGCVLSELRRDDEAIAVFNEYLKAKPNDPVVIAYRGKSKSRIYDRVGALADLNRSIELDSTLPETLYIRGKYFSAQRDEVNAKNDFLKVFRLDSNYLYVKSSIAYTYYRLTQYDSAIIFFTKLLNTDPNNEDYLYFRADCRQELRDYVGAFDDAVKLMKLDPDNEKAARNAGMAATVLNKHKDALNYLNLCISKDSTDIQLFWARSLVLDSLKDYQASLRDLNKCVSLDPTNPRIYVTRGVMLLLNFQIFTAALKDYNKAIELDPTYGRAYFCRGLYYADFTSNRDKACADFMKARENGYDPGPEIIERYCQ